MGYVLRGGFIVPDAESCESPCKTDPVYCSDHVYYTGPNLPCSGVRTGDNFTDALQKIDTKLCELIQTVYNLTSTTTAIIN